MFIVFILKKKVFEKYLVIYHCQIIIIMLFCTSDNNVLLAKGNLNHFWGIYIVFTNLKNQAPAFYYLFCYSPIVFTISSYLKITILNHSY